MHTSKPNLVVIHSFPTNSILLKGLSDFLANFFRVYMVDLPGFVKHNKPLEVVSIENYASYVEEQIDSFKLESYIIGGISFGFIVILKMKLDSRCKGIFAIEPYVGRNSLSSKRYWKYTYYPLISVIDKLNLIDFIWKSKLFRFVFTNYFLSDLPKFVPHAVLNQIDGKTFVKTLKLILTAPDNHNLHSEIPHVLFVNRDDKTLRSTYLENIFKKKAKKLLIIEENVPHFPNDLSENYFKKTFTDELVMSSISFINQNK